MMSERRAPSALRRPISRVRSLTTISMMFMMTMPADDERQRDDADQHREDAVRRLAVEREERFGREQAEVVRLLRPEAPRDPQRQRRVVHRLVELRDVLRLDRQRQLPARAENHLELAERDDGERVLRAAQKTAALRR